jgi:hypothetical protein
MTEHPAYNNNVFCVHADFAKLGDDIPKELSPQMRVQMKDFPSSKMDKVLPFEKGKGCFSNDYYGPLGTFSAMFTFFLNPYGPFKQGSNKPIGKTTNQLIKESGDVIILNLKEYDELL